MKAEDINLLRQKIIEKKPLVHCITNPISINQCANLILALGGKPTMVEHPKEVLDTTKSADALLLNLGNITDARRKSIVISAKAAFKNNIPTVLDLVGVSSSRMRQRLAFKIIRKFPPTIIKGNYSEIYSLFDLKYKSRGVDADQALSNEKVSAAASSLSKRYKTTVLASGKIDIIADGEKITYIKNGVAQLADITGTGCMLGAACGCFASVSDGESSAISACALLGLCGEMSQSEKGCGSFSVKLFDNLSVLTNSDINEEVLKIEED